MRAQTGRKVEVWWSKSREEPWRAQAASTRQSRSNPNFRGNRVDTIFRAGLPALLFFLCSRLVSSQQACFFAAGLFLWRRPCALLVFLGMFERTSHASSSRRSRCNATDQSDPAHF